MPRTGRWFWPLAGVAALALLWFTISQRRARINARESVGSAVVDTLSHAGRVVGSAGGEVSGAIGGLGAITTKVLPNGVALRVPENGVESELVGFIEDRTRPVDETTWFNFDRVNFATNSATITPESHDQLNNIAAIMKAYPNVNVTVGGYTDNVGGAAANRRLSQRRADAVQRELTRRGIPLSRVNAKGYGDEHPVADNATEEGRAQNRRIAVRVSAK
jgi:outer membrane protein OmpA-like peptidoglycan-associated protein